MLLLKVHELWNQIFGAPAAGAEILRWLTVRTRRAGRDGGEPSCKLRRSHCYQANLPASTLYSLENVGKSVCVCGGGRGGGESCQSLLTSENARQQLGLDMFDNGKSRVTDWLWHPNGFSLDSLHHPQKLCFLSLVTKTQPSLSCALLQSQKWLPASSLQTLCPLLSLGYSPGPPGSVSQSVSDRVCEAGAGPAVVGLQCPRLHDVNAYR